MTVEVQMRQGLLSTLKSLYTTVWERDIIYSMLISLTHNMFTEVAVFLQEGNVFPHYGFDGYCKGPPPLYTIAIRFLKEKYLHFIIVRFSIKAFALMM